MAAVTVLMTSCEKENVLIETDQELSTISFKVNTPELSTRAYSDGSTVTRLQYAVYDANGKILPALTETDEYINGVAYVELQLVTGNKYSVIFWAAAPNAPYAVDFEEKTMTVNYNNALCNDEKRDAFFAYKEFTVDGSQTEELILKRPFAQLNIGTADYTLAEKAGYVPTTSTVTVKNAFSTLDLATGTVSGETEVTFKENDIKKNEKFPINGYEYIAMNYILVPDSKTIVDIEFSFSDGTTTKKRTVGSAPVQRNYRTNIYGNIITSDVDVDININPDYGGDNNTQFGVKIGDVCFNSLDEAYNAAQDGDELVVIGDIVIASEFIVEKNIILNLNGYEITTTYNSETQKHLYAFNNKAEMVIKNGTVKARGIYNYGTLTLEDGAVIDACDGNGGYGIYNEGTLVMKGGEVKASYEDDNLVNNGGYDATPIYTKGTLTINNGKVVNNCDYTYALDIQGGIVTINGGEFISIHSTVSNYGNLTINGGSFICNGLEGITAHVLVAWVGSTTTVNGGSFNGKDNYNGFNVDAVDGSIVYIKGGEFLPVHSGSLYGEGIIVVSGGTFHDQISDTRLADGYSLIDNGNGTWSVDGPGWYKDEQGNYHIYSSKGWLWMADQADNFFGSKTIYLDNDIDFSGVDMRVTRMWTPEYSATFDGQNHTISNVWMASNYSSDNQGLFEGLMSVKNLKVTNTHVYGMSQVGIIGANIFGNIENCHVKNSRSYGYVHHVGGIVGLHSWGEIKNCSVEATKIECYYYGAVGAIAGAMNEVSRKITGCTVKNCALIKEGPEGVYPDWDPLYGIVVGYMYASGNYVFGCDIENTTIKGVVSNQVYGGLAAGSTVTFNGVQL